MKYTVNIPDIEQSLRMLGGNAKAKAIQDLILERHCSGAIPENYQDERSFRQTIQRKIEDYCPQAEGFDGSKKEGKFFRVGYGTYSLTNGYNNKEFIAAEEVPDASEYVEGATKQTFVNYFERNVEARSKCIAHYGFACFVCSFDFEKVYGEIGNAFIHVHHIVPLSEIKASYVVDPIEDLRPVCANCHAIIHRTTPALSINAVVNSLKKSSR